MLGVPTPRAGPSCKSGWRGWGPVRGAGRAGRPAVLPGNPGALEGRQEWLLARLPGPAPPLLRPGSFQRPVACSWARPCFLGTFSPLGLEMRREAGSLLAAGGVCREGDASLSLVRLVVGILEIVILFLVVRRAVTQLLFGRFLPSYIFKSACCALSSLLWRWSSLPLPSEPVVVCPRFQGPASSSSGVSHSSS